MATNFRISVHRNSENLHLRLMGDFDGTSAHELLNVLKRYVNRTSRVFHNDLKVLKGKSVELVFTGENASRLAPEKALPFDLAIATIPAVARSETPISALSSMKTR